jgi:hypothetical protein
LEKFKSINNNNNIQFNASDGWCTFFKKRWNLSTQRVKISRIATKLPTSIELTKFIEKCNKYMKEVPKKFFSIMMKQV